MNWYSGSIAEAVAHSKSTNAIFVVYVEGKNEISTKLTKLIDDERIRTKLESDDFVAVKIEADTEAYGHFRSIYQLVPVPSLFFIGKDGSPLEIGVGIISSVEDVLRFIKSALEKHKTRSATNESKKEAPTTSTTTKLQSVRNSAGEDTPNQKQPADTTDLNNKIAANTPEQLTSGSATPITSLQVDVPQASVTTAAAAAAELFTGNLATSNIVDLATPAAAPLVASTPVPNTASAISPSNVAPAVKIPTIIPSATTTTSPTNLPAGAAPNANMPSTSQSQQQNESTPATTVNTTDSEERLQYLQKVLEEKRRERIVEEQRLEKEDELRRRREGKDQQNAQTRLREQELKNIQENLRRERLAAQEERDRIRAQIAADRAERIQARLVYEPIVNTSNTSIGVLSPSSTYSSENETRLQFRLPGGVQKTKNFMKTQTLDVVREYVKSELLAESGIREFILATNYPRREFSAADEKKTLIDLNLVPNAVVLVLTSADDSRLARSGGGVFNTFLAVLWALLIPAAKAFDYISQIGLRRLGQRLNERITALGWKRSGTNITLIQGDITQRRNLDAFMVPPNSSQANDSAGEMNTTTANESAAGSGQARLPAAPTTDFPKRPYTGGEANIHRLRDSENDKDDENATYNGNSTQQQ